MEGIGKNAFYTSMDEERKKEGEAWILADRNFRIGEADRRLYGTFLEPIHRIVNGCLYNPQHPEADEEGFRRDVTSLLSELGTTFIRYPGGNFVSGYHWKEGIGPKEKRPRKYDLAWGQEENNQVGIDEFCQLCERLGIEPMLVVNLGTGTSEEAVEELEYCNYDGTTQWACNRRENGRKTPYGVRLWGLGNEMDGTHQIEHKTAQEYARKAVETARMMKKLDPSVSLILCGSCSPEPDLITYPEWDRLVLEEAYLDVDYISLHRYYSYDPNNDMYACNVDTLEDIAHLPADIEDYIDTVMAASRFVQGKLRVKKRVTVSFDEWGILTSKEFDREKYSFWTEVCPLERSTTVLDAVLHGAFLITLLNRCDTVRLACQSIVIGSMICVDPEGGCFRQTTFYPFRDVASMGRSVVLRQVCEGPCEQTEHYGTQPSVISATMYDPERHEAVIFAVNLSKEKYIRLEAKLQNFGSIRCLGHSQLYEKEAFLGNTFEEPLRVIPHEVSTDARQRFFDLPPISWNVLRFAISLEE